MYSHVFFLIFYYWNVDLQCLFWKEYIGHAYIYFFFFQNEVFDYLVALENVIVLIIICCIFKIQKYTLKNNQNIMTIIVGGTQC